MSPTRISRGGDPFDRALVRAGRNDDPPCGAEERALTSLGLATGVTGAGRSASAAVGRSAGWVKGVAVGAAVAVGIGVAVGYARRQEAAQVAKMAPTVAFEAATPRPEALAPPLTEPPRAVGPPGATASSRPAPAPRAAGEAPPKLASEVTIIQQAARTLASGDALATLVLLDSYRRAYPHGTLEEEAGGLRVQALVRSGRTAEAKAVAREILDAHPRGVLAARLRGVLATEAADANGR